MVNCVVHGLRLSSEISNEFFFDQYVFVTFQFSNASAAITSATLHSDLSSVLNLERINLQHQRFLFVSQCLWKAFRGANIVRFR